MLKGMAVCVALQSDRYIMSKLTEGSSTILGAFSVFVAEKHDGYITFGPVSSYIFPQLAQIKDCWTAEREEERGKPI